MANNKSTTGRKKAASPKKTQKEPIPINSGTPSQAAASVNPDNTPLTQAYPGIEEEIRRRAYELYEERGRHEGFHDQDWARAETEILARHGKQEKSA